MTDIAEIMETIDKHMKEKKIPRTRLAKDLNISPNAVTRWFKGLCEPTMYHLVEMIDLIGLEIVLKEQSNAHN